MCFSAKTSFLTATSLTITGLFTLKHVKNSAQRFLAAIPFMFATQQTAEGILWLTVINSSLTYPLLAHTAMFTFLFFAFIVWPTWIPLSLYYLEKKSINKKMLFFLLIIGLLWSISLLIILIKYPTQVKIDCSHIYYDLGVPFKKYNVIGFLIYILCTIIPFFLTSRLSFWIFGSLVAISCFITIIFWKKFLISVWCFFAALLSLLIYIIIRWHNFKSMYEKVLEKYSK